MENLQNKGCYDPDFNNCGCAGGFAGFIDGRFANIPGFVGFDNLDYRGFDNLDYRGFDNLDFRNVGTVASGTATAIGAASGIGKPGPGSSPAPKTNMPVFGIVIGGIAVFSIITYMLYKKSA